MSELIKQESAAKLLQRKDTETIKIEEPDFFESDSNDEKSLESLKREMQLSNAKENAIESIVASEEDAVKAETSVSNVSEPIKMDIEPKEEKVDETINEEIAQDSTSEEVNTDPTNSENFSILKVEDTEEKAVNEGSEEEKEEEKMEEKENAEENKEKLEQEEETLQKDVEEEKPIEESAVESTNDAIDVFEDAEEEIIEEKTTTDETIAKDKQEESDTAEATADDDEKEVKNEKEIETVDDTHANEKAAEENAELVEVQNEQNENDKPEPIIVIEESEDAASDENASVTQTITEVTLSDETAEKLTETSSQEQTTISESDPRRKTSTDDEFFEDAKEQLPEMKTDEPEQTNETVLSKDTIMIVDTDDDSPIEVIKEDKTGRTKRDYSRRKQESNRSIDKRSEEATSGEEVASTIGSRLKLKDRERSESPYIEEDTGEPATKSRRRYSSTPNIDSLPNSPASSDDREYRGWKKSILLVYNALIAHKYASLFAKPITEDQAPNYKTIVLQPMDLQTLKRNIDSGQIRTTLEFQRYVMLMCYNAIFYNFNDEVTCTRAKEMLTDALTLIDDMETWKKENDKSAASSSSSSTTKVVRGRKSNRLMN